MDKTRPKLGNGSKEGGEFACLDRQTIVPEVCLGRVNVSRACGGLGQSIRLRYGADLGRTMALQCNTRIKGEWRHSSVV